MKHMTVANIAKACAGVFHGPQERLEVTAEGVVIDSRKAASGFVFIATKGERVDGHSFIRQVMEKGALCVIAEHALTQEDFGPDAQICYIQVTDSFQALKDIAAFYRQQLTIPVIGITGSVGKTSTKEMIAGVLSAKYKVLKTEGNLNNEIGMPLTILSIREEHEAAVVEMGISDFGEMSRLTAIARPDICLITNIGQCHLETLGTRDGILKAKTEIFEGLSQDGIAVLNGADDKLAAITQVHGKKPYFFNSETCYATDVVSRGLFGTDCLIHNQDEIITAKIRVPGVHQVSNAAAAVVVAAYLGMTKEEIERGISDVQAIGGRNHIVQAGDYTVIDDCYNANPVSVKAALDLLGLSQGRRVAVLGDMLDLGENSDALHRDVGAYAVTAGTDVLVCIGQQARYIETGAREQLHQQQAPASAQADGLPIIYYFEEKAAFWQQRDGILRKGDTILLKASHGMAFHTLLESFTGAGA